MALAVRPTGPSYECLRLQARGTTVRRVVRHLAWLGKALFGLSVFALESPVSAQVRTHANGDGMDTHLFRPAVDSKGFFSVNGSDILGHQSMSFGMVLDYGSHLMRTRAGGVPIDAATGKPCEDQNCVVADGSDGSGVPALVQNSFQATFSFNYGLFNRAVVGITMPVVLLGGDPAYQIGPAGQNSSRLNEQAFSFL